MSTDRLRNLLSLLSLLSKQALQHDVSHAHVQTVETCSVVQALLVQH